MDLLQNLRFQKEIKLRRIYIMLCSFLIIFCCPFFMIIHRGLANQSNQKPLNTNYNVVLIAINVLRPDHLGCYGYNRNTSPAIDKLAKESFVFKSAFAQAGYTLPSMMSIITSLYPASHGVLDAFKDELSSRIYTIAEILKIYGYKTAWFSMLHLGHLDINVGFGRGFEYKKELDKQFKGKELILSWIEEKRDEPFFIALNTRSLHTPYFPLAQYKDYFRRGEKGIIIDSQKDFLRAFYYKIIESINSPGTPMYNILEKEALTYIFNHHKNIKREKEYGEEFWQNRIEEIAGLIPPKYFHRLGETHVLAFNSMVNINNIDNLEYLISLYDACLLGIDQELIKPIVKKLEDLNLYDRTILIISGDHGELFGEHKILGHGIDARFYDEAIQVPLIFKFPHYRAGKEIDGLAQGIDIMPTILDVLGMKCPAYIQGKSLLPLMQNVGSKPIHDHIYGQDRYFAYCRSLNWKLIVDRSDLNKESSNKDRLFHIREDPDEMADLKFSQIGIYNHLRKNIKEHLRSLPIYVDREYTFKPHIDRATQEKIKKTGYW